MLRRCWLGDRKGIRPVKSYASKPFGMVVNVGGRGTPMYPMGTKYFGLSYKDAQDMDGWRLRIKGATS